MSVLSHFSFLDCVSHTLFDTRVWLFIVVRIPCLLFPSWIIVHCFAGLDRGGGWPAVVPEGTGHQMQGPYMSSSTWSTSGAPSSIKHKKWQKLCARFGGRLNFNGVLTPGFWCTYSNHKRQRLHSMGHIFCFFVHKKTRLLPQRCGRGIWSYACIFLCVL